MRCAEIARSALRNKAFLRGLVARGLSGVQLVISDAHPGLVAAIGLSLALSMRHSGPVVSATEALAEKGHLAHRRRAAAK